MLCLNYNAHTPPKQSMAPEHPYQYTNKMASSHDNLQNTAHTLPTTSNGCLQPHQPQTRFNRVNQHGNNFYFDSWTGAMHAAPHPTGYNHNHLTTQSVLIAINRTHQYMDHLLVLMSLNPNIGPKYVPYWYRQWSICSTYYKSCNPLIHPLNLKKTSLFKVLSLYALCN